MSSCSLFRSCVVVIALLFCCAIIGYSLYSIKTGQSNTDSTPGTRAVNSLEFVVVVSRHGNRRPLFSFPNEPYPDEYWSCKLGEITRYGKLGMYNLGMKVRSLYDGFLSSTYSSDLFYATSTALERTIMSGETFLAGLYPPKGKQIWNEDIPWQPIPVFTDSPPGPQIPNYPCPRYNNETFMPLKDFYNEYADVIKNVSDYLNKYSGGNASSPYYLYSVWDSLSTDYVEGFVLPEWTKAVFPQPLSFLIGQEFIAISAGTDIVTRIVSSALFIQIVGLMEGKINGTLTPDYKMYYYSAHDMNIVALQAVLGIPKSSINGLINPSSAFIYELHRDPGTGTHYVQVLYIDGLSPDLQPVPVNVPDCKNASCTFPQLLDITAKFRNFTSEQDECFGT